MLTLIPYDTTNILHFVSPRSPLVSKDTIRMSSKLLTHGSQVLNDLVDQNISSRSLILKGIEHLSALLKHLTPLKIKLKK